MTFFKFKFKIKVTPDLRYIHQVLGPHIEFFKVSRIGKFISLILSQLSVKWKFLLPHIKPQLFTKFEFLSSNLFSSERSLRLLPIFFHICYIFIQYLLTQFLVGLAFFELGLSHTLAKHVLAESKSFRARRLTKVKKIMIRKSRVKRVRI